METKVYRKIPITLHDGSVVKKKTDEALYFSEPQEKKTVPVKINFINSSASTTDEDHFWSRRSSKRVKKYLRKDVKLEMMSCAEKQPNNVPIVCCNSRGSNTSQQTDLNPTDSGHEIGFSVEKKSENDVCLSSRCNSDQSKTTRTNNITTGDRDREAVEEDVKSPKDSDVERDVGECSPGSLTSSQTKHPSPRPPRPSPPSGQDDSSGYFWPDSLRQRREREDVESRSPELTNDIDKYQEVWDKISRDLEDLVRDAPQNERSELENILTGEMLLFRSSSVRARRSRSRSNDCHDPLASKGECHHNLTLQQGILPR